MKKIILVFVLIIIVGEAVHYFSMKRGKLCDEKEMQEEPQYPLQEAEIAVETFQTENKGWGYHISINGTKYISQTRKPAVGGDEGFSTQEDAQKVGSLAADKIRQGLLPPSISVEELDSLGVLAPSS